MDTPSSIEAGKNAIDRLRRNKTSVEFETTKIAIEESQLRVAEKMAKAYADSVTTLKESIERRKKTLAFALTYVADHEEDVVRVEEMAKLAKKIEKLKADLAKMEAQTKV